jgi:hypothetical protein
MRLLDELESTPQDVDDGHRSKRQQRALVANPEFELSLAPPRMTKGHVKQRRQTDYESRTLDSQQSSSSLQAGGGSAASAPVSRRRSDYN